MGQFVFTCLMLIWLFSISKVNAVHSSESPRFKIESKVNLEASISCGKGMFQKKQASMCILSANEGRKASMFSQIHLFVIKNKGAKRYFVC